MLLKFTFTLNQSKVGVELLPLFCVSDMSFSILLVLYLNFVFTFQLKLAV